MAGWIAAVIAAAIAAVLACRCCKKNRGGRDGRSTAAQNSRQVQNNRHIPLAQRSETGPMVYYANDRHGGTDREYRFNYKKVNGGWRAYILRMPGLGGRDEGSLPTHRLWDDRNDPYICWDSTVISLHDMQNVSREWADCIQEYIATGKRFGPQ